MKKSFISLYLLLFLAGIVISETGCKKPGSTDSQQPVLGVVRPVGVPTGNAVSASIGAAGGTLAYPDNSIKISVPQGALSETTTIAIQPVTHTNIGSQGKAFRLTPHGVQFSKPVGITISYADIEDSIGQQAFLGLCYQDAKGIWQFVGHSSIDTVNKTVTYNTRHFSDWDLMQWLSLKPVSAQVGPNEEVTIEAMRYVDIDKCNCDLEDLAGLVPDGPGYPIGHPVPLDNKYVDRWILEAPGTLIHTRGNKAVYTAPEEISADVVGIVTLKLKSKHTLLLISSIRHLSGGSFEIRINGGPWEKFPAMLIQLQMGQMTIGVTEDYSKLTIVFPQAMGTHAWGRDEDGNLISGLEWYPSGNYDGPYYDDFWMDEFNVGHTSGGGITITELGGMGQYTAGTFQLTKSGLFQGGKMKSTANIEGRFRLKRAL